MSVADRSRAALAVMAEQRHNFRLQALQHEVASAALVGIPCDEIDERLIEPSLASDEEKAALRLYSLSFLPRFELRRLALERLRGLSLEGGEDAHPGKLG